MRKDCLCGALLDRRQRSFELNWQWRAADALVIDLERGAVLLKQGLEIGPTAAGQSDVCG